MSALLSTRTSQLLVVDVQERLAPAMNLSGEAVANIGLLGRAAAALGVPITISEQYPKGLGPTLAPVAAACGDGAVVLAKTFFSCARDAALAARLKAADRPQILVCGFEAHVCVLQSAIDLAASGADVLVVADAIASRRADSKDIALRRLSAANIGLATTEMVVFEWLERAGTEDFKALAPLLR